MERQFYTVEEVHEITGLSKPTIYRAIQEKNEKKIPSLRVAGAIRIPKWWIDHQLLKQ
jgi:excisionase family DNA binding protein